MLYHHCTTSILEVYQSRCSTSETYLLSQRSQPLLLRVGIDISANGERDDVEKWHPGLFRQEFLGKRKRQWRGNPANPHHREETRTNRSADLVVCSGASNESH